MPLAIGLPTGNGRENWRVQRHVVHRRPAPAAPRVLPLSHGEHPQHTCGRCATPGTGADRVAPPAGARSAAISGGIPRRGRLARRTLERR